MASTTSATELARAASAPVWPNRTGRLGSRWRHRLARWAGLSWRRRLARAALLIDRIRFCERSFATFSGPELLHEASRLRGHARAGNLDAILPEVFGLGCVAATRTLGLRPFDVQLAAGVLLHFGAVAELATGEGKTLVATLPAALNALSGKGVHVATVNDYLARRDAEWTAPMFVALGLTVGILQPRDKDPVRYRAYRADITYGTSGDFGFDFLRDQMKRARNPHTGDEPFWAPWSDPVAAAIPTGTTPCVQRDLHFALVDECDSIFIDDAKTPLIIGGGVQYASPSEADVYLWADETARKMVPDEHFRWSERLQRMEFTPEGERLMRYSGPPTGADAGLLPKLYDAVRRALIAHHQWFLDKQYVVDAKQRIVLIDEATGRPQPDRHLRDGQHQAIEAKERVPVTRPTEHAAQITFQAFFRLYRKLAGMTGTAAETWREMRRVYKLWVIPVPTNQPVRREQLPDRVFPTLEAKYAAVVAEVQRVHATGRPVLIGTRSLAVSEVLSERLSAAGIVHSVLNARPENLAREAETVAQAGRLGTVTIATNMAGRGTDIILGGNAEGLAWLQLEKYESRLEVPAEEWHRTVEEVEARENLRAERERVAALGGLCVIGTERHETSRIDRQLSGRAGRQGDPGSSQFFLSLEDPVLEELGYGDHLEFQEIGRRGGEQNWQKYHCLFEEAQHNAEKKAYKQRVQLMKHTERQKELLDDIGANQFVD